MALHNLLDSRHLLQSVNILREISKQLFVFLQTSNKSVTARWFELARVNLLQKYTWHNDNFKAKTSQQISLIDVLN